MTDSYFVGTIARVHNLWRFGGPSSDMNLRPSAPSHSSSTPPSSSSSSPSKTPVSNKSTPRPSSNYLTRLAAREIADNKHSQASGKPQERVGMMVSLDHTYAIFHSISPFAFLRIRKSTSLDTPHLSPNINECLNTPTKGETNRSIKG